MRKTWSYILLFSCHFLFSQEVKIDTIEINLSTAEDLFIKNNYSLLAEKYNVDATKSLIKQAALFNNPNVYYENSVFNRYSGKYFPTDKGKWGDYNTQGEFIVQYNYLFSIAGKRNKSVKLAKAKADVAQFEFDDLIRTLLFALRSDFYALHYGLKSISLLDEEIESLKKIVSGFELQYQKGNISLRELTRSRALLLALQSDKLNTFLNLQTSLKEFSVLLNNPKNTWYKPLLSDLEADAKYPMSKVVLADLLTQSMQNRPDLKAMEAQLTASDANFKLQKAIGVPDIMVQGVFDRNGSYINNYNGAGLSIPIAIFNRNQGNVESAKFLINSAEQQLQQKKIIVQNDVYITYEKILESVKLNSTLNSDFLKDFKSVLAGAQNMFDKKNISLLEFVDLFESYKESMIYYNNIRVQRLTAFEELNFNVGKDVFKQ